ncbi:GNAT family N-acetyltransferase [Candidatus Saccharibacteria bacterium]|nr:GNAT family N-acetyltransferase [Candidatus Saccharibacteria bacterium]
MSESKDQKWTVATATPEQAEGLAAVQAAAMYDTYYRDGDDEFNALLKQGTELYLTADRLQLRRQLIEHASETTNDEIYLSVVNAIDEVIGILFGKENELLVLYTDKKYRRQGIGRALLERYIDWSDHEKPIELGVIDDNLNAQKFYEHMGFRIVPDSLHPFADAPMMNELTMIRPPQKEIL